MKWSITAKELENFCNTNPKRAQELLPDLTYRLIKASVQLNKIHIPKGNSISNHGWDGLVETQEQHRIIPFGKSFWEFGTDKDINSKAEKDYEKRLEDSSHDITFVFGTFRVWTKKEDFCKKHKNNCKWKEVETLNSVDYESWLEDHPSIALWLAKEINKLPPQSVKLISTKLQEWKAQTEIELKDDLVLYNRDGEQDALIELLKYKNGIIDVIAPSWLEGLIFVLSIINKDKDYMDRALILQTQEVWDRIVENHNGLILLYEGFEPINIGHTSRKHLVIRISDNNQGGLESQATKQDKNKVILAKQNKKTVLEKMGFSALDAGEINKDTYGYLDLIAIHPKLKPIDDNATRQLKEVLKQDPNVYYSLFLSGAWDSRYDGDRKFLEAVSGKEYTVLEDYIHKIENINFLETSGPHYKILLKKLIVSYFCNNANNEKFCKNAKNIFSEKDKAFKEQQEFIPNPSFLHSSILRKELADTLIILAMINQNWQGRVDAVLQEAIDQDNIVESLFSLRDVLHLLAEASPNTIIDCFEPLLSRDSEQELLERFFEKDTTMFLNNSHCLFQALKIIAWDQNHFVRVIKILFKLAKIKFCKQDCLETLHSLFLGWFHNTSTSHSKRIALLENLYMNNSEIVWNILCGILPSGYEANLGFSCPKHRDWCDGINFNSMKIPREYFEYVEEATKLILQYTDNLAKSFYCVSTLLLRIDNKYQLDFVNKLETFLPTANSQEKFEIKQKIIKQISDAQEFNWNISDECMNQMQKLAENIHFDDPIYENLHLFQEYHWDEKKRKQAHTQRLQAIKNMLHQTEVDNIFTLIRKANSAVCSEIGNILHEINHRQFEPKMLEWLVSDIKNEQLCAREFFVGNIDTLLQDKTFLEKITAQQRVELFKICNINNVNLKILKEQKLDEQKQYWESFGIYSKCDMEIIPSIFYTLISFDMFEKALCFLAISLTLSSLGEIKINIEDIAKAMLLVDPKKVNGGQDAYYYGEIIKKLQKVDLDLSIMFNIEWKFLQLKNFYCTSSMKFMFQNPSSFIDFILFNDDKIQKLDEESRRAYESNYFYFSGIFSFLHPKTKEPMLSIEEIQKWINEAIDYATKTQSDKNILYSKKMIGRLLRRFVDNKEITSLSQETLRFLDQNLEDYQIKEGFMHEIKHSWLPKVKCKKMDEGGEAEMKESEVYKKHAEFLRDKFYDNLAECFVKKSNQCKKEAQYEDDLKKSRQLL